MWITDRSQPWCIYVLNCCHYISNLWVEWVIVKCFLLWMMSVVWSSASRLLTLAIAVSYARTWFGEEVRHSTCDTTYYDRIQMYIFFLNVIKYTIFEWIEAAFISFFVHRGTCMQNDGWSRQSWRYSVWWYIVPSPRFSWWQSCCS